MVQIVTTAGPVVVADESIARIISRAPGLPGNPVADAVLFGELGGLDRNAYQTMFCLDDETLEAGGESILASKGDLGHLLFSATAGLADLSDRSIWR